MNSFQKAICAGIPSELPPMPDEEPGINHAPKRPLNLTPDEQVLAVNNALRYFPKKYMHEVLALEFASELKKDGRIYMRRFRPTYEMYARPISEYPAQCQQAAAIMHMIQNNLDPTVGQHPHELITYGGNGTVFQNWAQYLLTMQYLSQMTDHQTLEMYSGHPMGLFPSHPDAPRVVVTNGMMVPNYSTQENYTRLAALGVTSYGQMTAGSFMYIGSQGIVHGTTITLLGAARKYLGLGNDESLRGKVFTSSGLGGMSGAQGKASMIAGCVGVIAEINPKALAQRERQGWIDESTDDLDRLLVKIERARRKGTGTAIGYLGNIVDLWERLASSGVQVALGSDQTSLHNPFEGGYYPAGMSFEASKQMMVQDPSGFKGVVHESLRRQVRAINSMAANGMHFLDYGNAFLLEAGRAQANLTTEDGKPRYRSYVEDIMAPVCFDYGFGPFRWVCTSADPADLALTDQLAAEVISELAASAPPEIKQQYLDNLRWIKEAGGHKMVIGSQARILYSDEVGRRMIAEAFNRAVADGRLKGPVVGGRDHHDTGGTDSPFRETADIRDGSMYCADMAVQNFVGDSFRGATWVSLHNGGGVGWGEVINGGFGMVLDGTDDAQRRLHMLLAQDVNNGIARRSWAGNKGAIFTAQRAMERHPSLQLTLPERADQDMVVKTVRGVFAK